MSGSDSTLQQSGDAADSGFAAKSPHEPTLPCEQKTWVDILLVDAAGEPIPNEEFRLTLPDGTVITGKVDENGLGGVDGVVKGEGTLEFPNLNQPDASVDS